MSGLITKLLGVGILVIGEVQDSLKDKVITLGEILKIGGDVVNKLGYSDLPVIRLKSDDKK